MTAFFFVLRSDSEAIQPVATMTAFFFVLRSVSEAIQSVAAMTAFSNAYYHVFSIFIIFC